MDKGFPIDKEFLIACILTALLSILIACINDVDEYGMDSYDRQFGHAGDKRTRGIFGTIYDSNGNTDVWRTLFDPNPFRV